MSFIFETETFIVESHEKPEIDRLTFTFLVPFISSKTLLP